mgnify:FL=1
MNRIEIIVVKRIRIKECFISVEEKKRADVITLIARILVYSAIKIRANIPLLYSTLNPDTSSDSPSAKSKGVRLVSARMEINHIIDTISSIRITQDLLELVISVKSIFSFSVNIEIRISAILISYEMVCAMPRRAPSSAYLELDPQPAMKVE